MEPRIGGERERRVETMSERKKYDFKNLHYRGKAGILIPELQRVQELDGYITRERIHEIHRQCGIPLTTIFGVATFYAQFRLHPVGKHIIRVCHGTACHVAAANGITKTLEDILEIATGETTKDKLFTLETVACLGCCSLAPVIMVNNNTHGNLKPDGLKKIIRQYRKASEGTVEP